MIVWLCKWCYVLARDFRLWFRRLLGDSMKIPVLSSGLIDTTRVRFFNLVMIGKRLYANLEVDGQFFTCPASADLLELLVNSFPGVSINKVENWERDGLETNPSLSS